MTLNESIGRFNVRKTLRFEMKPLGKTAENLDAFLAEDEERASDLNTIKTFIEAEHLALVRRVFNALPDPLPGYSEIKHSFKRDPAYPVLSERGTVSVVKAIIERCSQTRLKVPKQVRNLERWQPLFIKWHWHCLSLYTDNGENSVAREWAGRSKADVEATSRFLRGARKVKPSRNYWFDRAPFRMMFDNRSCGMGWLKEDFKYSHTFLMKDGDRVLIGVTPRTSKVDPFSMPNPLPVEEAYQLYVETADEKPHFRAIPRALVDAPAHHGSLFLFELCGRGLRNKSNLNAMYLRALLSDGNVADRVFHLDRVCEFYVRKGSDITKDGKPEHFRQRFTECKFFVSLHISCNPDLVLAGNRPQAFGNLAKFYQNEPYAKFIIVAPADGGYTIDGEFMPTAKANSGGLAGTLARLVVEKDAYVLIDPAVPEAIRRAVKDKFSYIVVRGREPYTDGGIMRGYQLVDRVFAGKPEDLQLAELGRRSRGAGGRAVIETAAWRWGFMEGNALSLFNANPQAGSLKLPDLSLAIGFEHRLGLDGGKATVGKLVQTARIISLEESLDALRFCKDVKIEAKRVFTPRRGAEKDAVVYAGDSLRIIRDEGRYFLLAMPKFALYQYERDLLFTPGEEKSVAVQAYRCVSDEGMRSRHDNHIEEEQLDFNKIMNLARDGRVYFYSLDVKDARWLFDATYTLANKRPCRFIPTIPQLFTPGSPLKSCHPYRQNGVYLVTDVPADTETIEVRMMFTANPQVRRDGRKYEGRSWKSYCDAYPDDAGREAVLWPTGEATAESLKNATRRVVEADGILLTDAEHLPAALEGMGYVITQTSAPYVPGGIYHGYMLADRVFRSTDGRVEWREATGFKHKAEPEGKFDRHKYTEAKRKENMGKPLVEVLSERIGREAEAAFSERIEAEVLADKKTAKFFTLEAPIVIGDEFKAMVAREFRRVAYTGTMGWRQQIVRPAHEVALGIWLARLQPDPSLPERTQTRQNAPVRPPAAKDAPSPTPAQRKRLAALDALLAESLVTQDEYDAKRREIL